MLSKRLPPFKPSNARVHRGSTRSFGYPQFIDIETYGRIVDTGVGDAETIGDTVGTGCALAANVAVAPAMHVPARMIPTNHRFIATRSSFVGMK
jgi:hypothetical protein